MHPISLLITLLLTFSSCLATDLWVDAQQGDDHHEGGSPTTALRTLQRAVSLATPGTLVHIQPGVYRGSLRPLQSGTEQAPILYQAEQGKGSVKIRGSEVLSWMPLTENNIGLPPTVNLQNIVWADLSSWQLTQAPQIVMQLDHQGEPIKRLLPAREPDWQVETEWKHHEFWWAAEGGATISTCFPPQDKSPLNCDLPSRSLVQLTDAHDDNTPLGISPGNLTTLGNLIGATLVTLDPIQGERMFRRTIIDHEVNIGRITLDQKVQQEASTSPEGLGWGNKYYVENHPALLDHPGEYWFDVKTGHLYLWPITSDLQNIEVSRWDTGWDLTNLSYIILDGMVLEFFNGTLLLIKNNEQQSSYGNRFRHMQLRYARQGLYVEQTHTPSTRGLLLENSEIAYIDNEGLYLNSRWNHDEVDNTEFTSPPISDTIIQNNQFHHLAFRPQNDDVSSGLEFRFADHLRFENNHVHHIAFSGVNFLGSVIHSDKQRDFSPEEIKTGHLLIKNNLIEKACQLVAVCGGLRFVGTPPHRHVFRDVLLTGNTLRHHYGWSYASAQRHRWEEGEGGFGLHLKYATGIHAYRNLAYSNSSANFFIARTWRDGEIILYNNLFAHAAYGINLWNPEELDSQTILNTQIVNNIFVNNAKFALQRTLFPVEEKFILDYNLYFMNGWNLSKGGLLNTHLTLDQLQTQTPWEQHGLILDPAFVYYHYAVQQQTRNNSLVDFHLTPQSAALDRGNSVLPASLSRLLSELGIQESLSLPDIGPYESLGTPYRFQGVAYPDQETQTQFTSLVITSLGQGGNHLVLSSQEEFSLLAHVLSDPRDVGQKVEIKMVAAYTPPQAFEPTYFMRHGPSWKLWDQQFSSLMSVETSPSLPQQFDIPVYEGNLKDMPGNYIVYVGYTLSNGTLIFNGQDPIQFSIQ